MCGIRLILNDKLTFEKVVKSFAC